MAFPPYIETRLVTSGRVFYITSGREIRARLTVNATRDMIWADTGDRWYAEQFGRSAVLGESAEVELPITRQAGWMDMETKGLIDISNPDAHTHFYTAEITFEDELGRGVSIPRVRIPQFAVPPGAEPIDLDTMVVGETVEGTPVLLPDMLTELVERAEQAAADARAAVLDSDAFIAGRIRTPGSETEQALSDTIDGQAAASMANPESELNSATIDLIVANAVPPANTPYEFFIGDETNAERPDWGGPVRWLTTVETKPANVRVTPPSGTAPDTWAFVVADPLPDVLVWADTFNRANGTLGVTSAGGLAWETAGVGAWGIESNMACITATGSGAGSAFVDSGYTRTLFEATVSTQQDGYASVLFRYVDENNRYTVPRVSGAAQNYRLTKRISGTSIDIAVTSVPMESGDRIVVDDREIGALKVSVFKGATEHVIFEEGVTSTSNPPTELATATKVGLYCGSMSGGLSSAAWDDVSLYRVA